ncbi:hypothetical protein RO3G_04019 [Rhizopus delemar RA 99-880]|uniref:Proteasome assembly chaperone 1 n=1 Tax=Rhizopus delemar (strain RA 99-880 / ATCC MYA-4621 / FGSC 9543 / NRRL 43880) TaxID=246409 RepID=I1BSY4_RHIO9|nr:hypothetical protein RO3G_04019 [Rhizopus delemar RA 99-880]|eukprot:EIE79314.1 hypothetical protein RO3G_04019 [Rhizopus delemar RA 99-880]
MSTKESSSSKDTGYTTLPLKWTPGKDLLRSNIPSDAYHVSQTEWSKTKSSYTLYASSNSKDNKFFPILIAFYEEIGQSTILETMKQCGFVYEKFKLMPTVLIISTKCQFDLNEEDFSVDDDSFLAICESKFWANKCLLFSLDSISEAANSALISLCRFISNPHKTFLFSHNSETQTISLTCEANTSEEF